MKLQTFREIKINIVKNDEKNNYGKFIISPLEKGFGYTLGNALRRVLLSSLTGASVFAIEIDGIRHEFSSIDGVNEDVVDIILNLKKLVLKIDSDKDDTQKLEISKKGPCTVYAKDIKCSGLTKVVNPDLEIAHLAEGGKIHMFLFARNGRGYVTAETNKISRDSQNQIGYIDTDSDYSPVVQVNFSVEQKRIQYNLFDDLILEIKTNGSVKPQEALSSAANILIEHLKLFVAGFDLKKINFEKTAVKKENDKKEENQIDLLIEDLDLSVRSFNCLKRANIKTLRDLIQYSESGLENIQNLGERSAEEIKNKVRSLGFCFLGKGK